MVDGIIFNMTLSGISTLVNISVTDDNYSFKMELYYGITIENEILKRTMVLGK